MARTQSLASYEAGRRLLERGRRAILGGSLDRASESFSSAIACFAGPTSLLGGGHAWRGLAEVAVSRARWEEALSALDAGEALFRMGLSQQRSMKRDAEMERQLEEGVMVCRIGRADVALRRGQLAEARKHLNEAASSYRGIGDEGRTDFLRMCARLAEREGRWNAARMGWRRVVRMCARTHDDRGRTDASVRLTEVLVLLGRADQADDALAEAEEAARSTMDASLLGRVHMARAGVQEQRGEEDEAWERWESALEALTGAGPILQGLARVRMALLAGRIRPLEAAFLLREGLKHLVEGQHPDALGLVHHQLALVALEMANDRVAALAAVGAENARGFPGVATRSILERALSQAGDDATVEDLARLEGLVGTALGTRRSALELCDRLGRRQNTPRPVAARQMRPSAKFVWEDEEGVREAPLRDGLVTFGGTSEADIQLPADGVHVAIRKDASGVRIHVDPFSPQPVLLDGHAIRGEHFLTDGDVLTLGDLELKHILPAPSRPPPRRPTPPPAVERTGEAGSTTDTDDSEDAPREDSDETASQPIEAPGRGRGRLFGLVFVISTGVASALLGALLGAFLVLLFAVA